MAVGRKDRLLQSMTKGITKVRRKTKREADSKTCPVQFLLEIAQF